MGKDKGSKKETNAINGKEKRNKKMSKCRWRLTNSCLNPVLPLKMRNLAKKEAAQTNSASKTGKPSAAKLKGLKEDSPGSSQDEKAAKKQNAAKKESSDNSSNSSDEEAAKPKAVPAKGLPKKTPDKKPVAKDPSDDSSSSD